MTSSRMQHAERAQPLTTSLTRDRLARPEPGTRSVSQTPSIVVDEVAREEWGRVAETLFRNGILTFAQQALLAGYCNAVAKAVRAEQTLAQEGRYYQTVNNRGSIMRRRHPAAQDAEEGWATARKFAKQLGITGVASGDHAYREDSRRRLFK